MSLVVIIRGVTGLILLWRVMLGPDRTFLNAAHPRVVTWSQAGRSALTGSPDASQHNATHHLRWVHLQCSFSSERSDLSGYEKCCLIIVVWCSLVPTFRPVRNYRLLLPQRLGSEL